MEGYIKGRVSNIDRKKGFVQVEYPEYDNIPSDWLPLVSSEFNMPQIGETVGTVINKNGQGVCLGGLYSNSHKPPVQSGFYKIMDGVEFVSNNKSFEIRFNHTAFLEYDKQSKSLTIKADYINIIQNNNSEDMI